MMYDPFEVLDKMGDNSYRLSIPPYMHIYFVLNVKDVKLYESSMLDNEHEQVLPSLEDLVLEDRTELKEDTFLQNNSKNTMHGQYEL